MKCLNRPKCIFRGTALLVLVLDVISKMLAEKYRPDFFMLGYAENTGAAFGIMKGSGIILAAVSLAVIALILYYHIKRKMEASVSFFMSLMFAGALGNLIDRLFRGFVVDFIDLGFWPAFNIADIAITAGVIGLIYVIYKK